MNGWLLKKKNEEIFCKNRKKNAVTCVSAAAVTVTAAIIAVNN